MKVSSFIGILVSSIVVGQGLWRSLYTGLIEDAILMEFPYKRSPKVFKRSLFTFCLCGLFGILPDLDHPIASTVFGIPLDEPTTAFRFFHLPVFIISSTLILIMCAYLGGLAIRLVLKKRGIWKFYIYFYYLQYRMYR